MTAPSDSHAIEQARSRLAARRAELVIRTRRVADDLRRSQEPLSADAPDRAIQTQNDAPLQVIEAAALSELQAVDEALERIHLGLYGICKHCEARIAPARLQAVPHAVTCVDCARITD